MYHSGSHATDAEFRDVFSNKSGAGQEQFGVTSGPRPEGQDEGQAGAQPQAACSRTTPGLTLSPFEPCSKART